MVTVAWAWALEQWPQVYPNLIAGAIQGGAVYLWARYHVRKLHDSNERLHAANERLHARLDVLHRHITGEKPTKEQQP